MIENVINSLDVKDEFEEIINSKGDELNDSALLSLIELKDLILKIEHDDEIIIAVQNETPEDKTHTEKQEKAIFNNETNKYEFINIFSKEYVNEIVNEHDLKVEYFDTPKNKGINLAVISNINSKELVKDSSSLEE